MEDWDYRIDHEEVERSGLKLERPMKAREFFQELQEHQDTLPVAVRRGDVYLPFHSGTTLQEKDRVILLQVTDARLMPFDRFDRLAVDCPVLDIEQPLSADAFFEMAAASLAPRLEMETARVADLLMDRERTGSTVLLPGLAIPHVIIEGHERFELAIARCRGGILFPGQHERVHAVFVLASTGDQRNFHLRALSAIAQIIQVPDFEHAWLLARDAEALRRIVLRASRRRSPEQPDALSSYEPTVML